MSGRLIILLAIMLNVLWTRWAIRRLRRLQNPVVGITLVILFEGLIFSFLLVWMVDFSLLRNSHSAMPVGVVAGVICWNLMILPAMLACVLVARAGKAAGWVFGKFPRSAKTTKLDEPPPASAPPGAAPVLSRRRFLAASAVAAGPVLIPPAVFKSSDERAEFRVNRQTIWIPQLPPELEGLNIAHITDTHLGRLTPISKLNDVADCVNALRPRPDFIALTGDLIDYSLDDLDPALEFVDSLDPSIPRAMCVGNHDIMISPREFVGRVKNWLLDNMQQERVPQDLLVQHDPAGNWSMGQSMIVKLRGQEVNILGGPWNRSTHLRDNAIRDLLKEQQKLRPDLFQIFLVHHPEGWDPAVEFDVPLTLSGHTHGGQIMLTRDWGYGTLNFKYLSGLYRKNNSALVVSNGVGDWFPLRINAPAEIGVLTLTRFKTA